MNFSLFSLAYPVSLRFKFRRFHLLAMEPWANYLSFLSLGSLSIKYNQLVDLRELLFRLNEMKYVFDLPHLMLLGFMDRVLAM